MSGNPLNKFRRISESGQAVELKSLTTKKSHFSMTGWNKQKTIISLGGWHHGSSRLNEVQQFLIAKNKWTGRPSLSEEIFSSSATVLNDVLYNFRGYKSTNSVCWLDLLSKKAEWNSLKTLGETDF